MHQKAMPLTAINEMLNVFKDNAKDV